MIKIWTVKNKSVNVWTGFNWHRIGTGEGSCELSNGTVGSIKGDS
jgi:hypothetical protein